MDEANVTGISCPTEVKFHFKEDAKVMVVNENIKNGTTGNFIGLRGDKLEVERPNNGKVVLKRQTWSKRDTTARVVESCT